MPHAASRRVVMYLRTVSTSSIRSTRKYARMIGTLLDTLLRQHLQCFFLPPDKKQATMTDDGHTLGRFAWQACNVLDSSGGVWGAGVREWPRAKVVWCRKVLV